MPKLRQHSLQYGQSRPCEHGAVSAPLAPSLVPRSTCNYTYEGGIMFTPAREQCKINLRKRCKLKTTLLPSDPKACASLVLWRR